MGSCRGGREWKTVHCVWHVNKRATHFNLYPVEHEPVVLEASSCLCLLFLELRAV